MKLEEHLDVNHLNKYLVRELFTMFDWYNKYDDDIYKRMKDVSDRLLLILKDYDTSIVWADEILLPPDHWLKPDIDEITTPI